MNNLSFICFVFINILILNCSHTNPALKIVPGKGHGARIIGGNTAHPVQFPYAAAIYVETSMGKYFCSGTLLSNLWVLTAGQCVNEAVSFQIFLGSINLNEDNSERTEVATSNSVLHPEYNPETLENDIGLIKFRMPITFTDYIKPIERLPLSEIPDFVTTSVFGWGQTSDEDAGLAAELQWVSVVTISNAECSVVYGSQITDKMVCAEGNYNEGTCYGDIGSPLIQYYSTGHAIPVGIASFVSNNGCESTDPSGFTRTFPYNAWIRNVTGLIL